MAISNTMSEQLQPDDGTNIAAQRADRERLEEVKREFTEKRKSYPDFWKPAYDYAKARGDFVFLGKQINPSEFGGLGITKPVIDNLLLAYLNQIANEQLQNDFYARVSPNGGGATKEGAQARQDALRGIQKRGNFAQVFNLGRRKQLGTGIAYTVIRTDYVGSRGFGKTIVAEDVEDVSSVFPDPSAIGDCTFSKAKDWLYCKKVNWDDWEQETGEKPQGSWRGERKEVWQYWCREVAREGFETKGASGPAMSWGDGDSEEPIPGGERREVVQYQWHWYKLTAEGRVLEEQIWPGELSPFVAWTGPKTMRDDGKPIFQSMTEYAEAPSRIYSLITNILLLRLGQSPFSRWLVSDESLSIKDDSKLRDASAFGDGTIRWKEFDAAGLRISKPEEIEPYKIDPMLLDIQASQVTKIKQILGIYDAFLGQNDNKQSGIALKELNKQGKTSNFHYVFNQNESIEQIGRVTLDLIPKELTEPQQLAFVDRDDQATVRWINQQEDDGSPGIYFDPDEDYQLVVEVGPMADTARQDEAEMLAELSSNPIIGPAIGRDPRMVAMVIAAQPGRYARDIADMMKASANNPEMAQAQQTIQQLQQQLQQATDARAFEATKESNRHQEAMAKIHVDTANNADTSEIAAYNAETARKKVDGLPQNPESLPASLFGMPNGVPTPMVQPLSPSVMPLSPVGGVLR